MENMSLQSLVKVQFWFFSKRKSNYLLLVFFFLAGTYGLYQGFAFKAKQITTIQSFRDDKYDKLNQMVEGFHADTTRAEGKAAYKKVTALNSSNWHIVLPVYKMPVTTAIYCIGQGDVFPYYYTIKVESFFMQLFKQGEIANPLRAMAGHFDVSFWIIYLLPLLILIFCFDAMAAELDNGNWRLLKSQGLNGRQWLQSRFMVIAVCIEMLLLVIFVAGLVINHFYFKQVPTITDFVFFLTANAYLGFWLSMLYLLNACGYTTSVSALYSGILWLVICLVMPTLVTTACEKLIAVDNTIVSRMSRRPQGAKFDDDAFGVNTIKKLGELRPQYKRATLGAKSQFFRFGVYMAYHELLDDTSKAKVQNYFERIEQRQTMTNASTVISPAAASDGIFSQLAANDAKANHYFIWQTMAFHGKLHDAYFPAIFFDRPLLESDYKKFPVFKNDTHRDISSIVFINLTLLIVLIVVFISLANKRIKTTHV